MIRTRWRMRFVATLTVLLTGCASTRETAEAPFDLYLDASSRVNPDSRGRPSPILVGIYGLKSTAVFEASGFPSLQDHAKATLGDDLVSFEQVILLPGEHKLIQRPGNPVARTFGIVAGYRELQRNVWKTTLVLPASEDAGFFSFWPFAPERVSVRVKLGEGGLVVRTMNRTH
ncbi:type VI secretion system lipoprotein TssJ [Paraburkholderia sediminicola]|uniref:type VI secretion system lipoprotein TssJ n=1 Tax=Paraburkholderia sediminicola TaxID=458836 RepID=UPI0038B92623